MPAKPNLRLITPATKKRAVAPLRRPNSELRSREHLTQTEVEKLIENTKDNRYGHRDATMILVAYRHGLRAARDLRSAVGADRLALRNAACPPSQERETKHSPRSRRRATSFTKAQAGSSKVTVCIRKRARWTIHDG